MIGQKIPSENGKIVKGRLDAFDLLVLLVTFAGDKHNIACMRQGDCLGYGFLSIAQNSDTRFSGLRNAGLHLRKNRTRILAAWIVGRQDDEVAKFYGEARHFGPLVAIAIASAPDDRDDVRTGCSSFPYRAKDVGYGIRCMCEVNNAYDTVGPCNLVETSFYWFDVLKQS